MSIFTKIVPFRPTVPYRPSITMDRLRKRRVAKPDVEPWMRDLQRWFRERQRKGDLFDGGTPPTGHTIGGTPEWPDWVTVELLANIATHDTGDFVWKNRMGQFLAAALPGIEKECREIAIRDGRRSYTFRYHRVFYKVGPWKDFHSYGDMT